MSGFDDNIESEAVATNQLESIDETQVCNTSLGNYLMAVVHSEMNPRRRSTMEDVHRMIGNFFQDEAETVSYFGVYDGHGGRKIVDFLEHALENNIAVELQQPDKSSISEKLSRAFIITDMESKRMNITTSGATAVVALISKLENGDRLLCVANVGDSRAVLVCQQSIETDSDAPEFGYFARRLSYDHRAEDPAEQQRITAAGGFILRNRVLGILAVSRSFGDHGMKDFVCANPYTSETNLSSCGECPFLILACDGVWDVFTDQEAGDFLLEIYISNGRKPFENAAHLLVSAAIERGSADNITAIVVFL